MLANITVHVFIVIVGIYANLAPLMPVRVEEVARRAGPATAACAGVPECVRSQ